MLFLNIRDQGLGKLGAALGWRTEDWTLPAGLSETMPIGTSFVGTESGTILLANGHGARR